MKTIVVKILNLGKKMSTKTFMQFYSICHLAIEIYYCFCVVLFLVGDFYNTF